METTVHLDADVEMLLRKAAAKTNQPLDKVLNDAVRNGLQPVKETVTRAKALGMAPELERANFNALADEMEDEAILAKLGSGPGKRLFRTLTC